MYCSDPMSHMLCGTVQIKDHQVLESKATCKGCDTRRCKHKVSKNKD